MLRRRWMVLCARNQSQRWFASATSKDVVELMHTTEFKSTSTSKSKDKPASTRKIKTKMDSTTFVAGLNAFHRLEGHFIVPFNFSIPDPVKAKDQGNTKANAGGVNARTKANETARLVALQQLEEHDWPAETFGLPLGKLLKQLVLQTATYKTFVMGHDQLEDSLHAIGFPIDSWKQYVWTTAVLPALRNYHQLHHGSMFIPSAFVVPYGDPDWPRTTWNYPLGRRVSKLRHERNRLSAVEQQQLDAIDFIWNVTESRWRQTIYPALKLFYVKHGHWKISQEYVIRKGDVSWPKDLRGIRLGKVVKHIRERGDFASVEGAHDQLRALDFVWDPSSQQDV